MTCDQIGDNNNGTVGDGEQFKVKNAYEQWTYHESKDLLKLLAKEVNNNDISRKEKITYIILPEINAQYGKNKDYNHVKNKLKNWKLRLEPTKELEAFGIGWDPVKQKFIASDEMWERLKKVNTKSASLRHKIFEDYEELKLVVGHYYPGWRDATVFKPSASPIVETKKDNIVGIEGSKPIVTLSLPTNDTPLSISQGPASAPSSSSTSTQRKRKAAGLEMPDGPLHANVEKLTKNFTSVKDSPHEVATELCNQNQHSGNKLLDAVDRVVEEMKWRAYEVFDNPCMKEAFLRMPDDERLRFLLFKLNQATRK